LLALLPFEPDAHRRLGGPPCSYVGHPLIERLDQFRPSAREAPLRDRPTLLVLPGSRRSEIRRLTAVFGDAVARVAEEVPGLDLVLPAVADLADDIRERISNWTVKPRVVTGEAAKLAAFRGARAALAASGTVTLELALAGVPMVVAYRVSPFETWLRFVVNVPSIVLPNLILGENAIPEFIQDASTPQALAAALIPLLGDTPARAAQLAAFARLDERMRIAHDSTPSREAAELVLATAARVECD
jgi:lipid-A-disaccharide synthase